MPIRKFECSSREPWHQLQDVANALPVVIGAYRKERQLLFSMAHRRRDAFDYAASLMRPRDVRIWMRPFSPLCFEVLVLDHVGPAFAGALWHFNLGNFEVRLQREDKDDSDIVCPSDLYVAGLAKFQAPWRVEAWLERMRN